MNLKRNGAIEFDRFLLCIAVALMHIESSTALIGMNKFIYGGYAVECFFVLSGFMLANSISKVNISTNDSIGKMAIKRFLKQFLSVLPYYYIGLFTTFIYRIYYYSKFIELSKEQWVQFISNFLAELFCLTGLSYRTFHVNGPCWYISALLISSFIITCIYLLLKKFIKKSEEASLFLGIAVFLFYMLKSNSVSLTISAGYILSRSIANLMLGGAFYFLFAKSKKYLVKTSAVIFDVLEILSGLFIGACFMHRFGLDRRIIAIAFGILIVSQFTERSHITKILNNDFCSLLGRLSLSIYLGQMLIICKYAYFSKYDLTLNRKLSYFVIFVSIVLWALIIEATITLFKKNILKKEIQFFISPRKLLLFGSILLFITSFSTEKAFFSFANMQAKNWILYIVCKLLLFVIELVIPQIIYNCVIKSENKKWIMVFTGIFLIYFICLLLSWPGNWNNDEFLILGNIFEFNIQYHQSFFTNIFYILSLMIIPNCGAIILFQMMICAIIATYVIKKIYERCGKRAFYALLLFLSPATIYYLIYPLRVCLYSFTFLLLIIKLFGIYKKDGNFTGELIWIGVLTAIVSTWRTESIFMIIFVPVVLIVTFYKKMDKRLVIYFLIATYLPFAIFSKVNGFGDKNVKQTALLWSFVTGFSVMLQDDNIVSPNLQEDLKNIDAIMNIEKMTQNAHPYDFYAVYNEIGPFEFTDKEYKDCVKSIARLIICNPIKYVQAKYELFELSTGLKSDAWWVSTPVSKENAWNIVSMYQVSGDILKIYQPINDICRESFVTVLTGMYQINETGNMAYHYIWNLWLPLVLLCILTVLLLIKKKIYYTFLNAAVIGDFMLVYLTAPTANPMYFWPFYLIGWVVCLYEFVILLKEHREEKDK